MNETNNIFRVPPSLITRLYDDGSALPPYRSEFMRDRDRLMYATAFRRLAGKTQIYTVGRDDHKKNRLTHTLEVAQISRTIAIALDLDPDLAEAIALAHDFGHTPFGHAGEEMLHEIMTPNSTAVKSSPFFRKTDTEIKERFEREKHSLDYVNRAYGFKHNLQSVRVAAVLEDSYRGNNDKNIGLNLTNFTLYGMMIHAPLGYEDAEIQPNFQSLFDDQMKLKASGEYAWSFEAYIVEKADEIAQWHHDLEDAMREEVLPISAICDTIKRALGKKLTREELETLDKISTFRLMDRKCAAELSHIVVNTLVSDLVAESGTNFSSLKGSLEKDINSEELFKNYGELKLKLPKESVISFSREIDQEAFRGTIRKAIHHSKNVERMNEKGKYIIRKLFEAYFAHPQQLPDGPILHLLIETNPAEFKSIDEAKADGIGPARIRFGKLIENPDIYFQCVLMRRVCDHIASMTDRYAIEEYNNLYG